MQFNTHYEYHTNYVILDIHPRGLPQTFFAFQLFIGSLLLVHRAPTLRPFPVYMFRLSCDPSQLCSRG